MHRSPVYRCLLAILAAVACGAVATAQQIEIVNNQPFPIRMPLVVRGVKLADGATAAQQVGGDAVVIVDAAASSTSRVAMQVPPNVRMRNRVELKPADDGVAIAFDGKDLGRLAWGVVVKPIDPKGPRTEEKALDTKADFAAAFQPLALRFAKASDGPVYETWRASGAAAGLKLDVELRAYRAGFLDVDARYTNESAPTKDVYAAIICRWEQPKVAQRTICYDSHVTPFTGDAYTPFRHGQGRHLYVQRGVDWINSRFDGAAALWLCDFTPNFTTHHEPRTSKTGETIGPRWLGANTAQVGQEAQATGDAVYSIYEIARPNIAGYLSRLAQNVLPPPGEGLLLSSRMVFDDQAITDERADQNFIAYVGYNPQETSKEGATRVSFGVPYTRFGTNYFAYSTLGENFVTMKQPGMSKDGYWPLAPETVKQYKLFADDIQRDLRIAKAMGFELIRLHHLEVLWDKDASGKEYLTDQQRSEYLDFYFAQLKHLQLQALVDVKLTPQQTAALVKRYRDGIEGMEIDNEALIFQIFDEDVQYWKDVYAAVKSVAPDMPVHWTTHTNTGAFERMRALGIPFDRVGAHAYMDSVEAIPSGKDYALAIADYATKVNKPPLITEWNWRFLTRMTPEARAKVYPPIFENVLKTKCMPIIYQFQFNDSLAMNPTGLKGIRHYELINVSRRPKPEALEMMELIQKYSNPDAATRKLRADYTSIELADGKGAARIPLANQSEQTLKLKTIVESSPDVKVTAPAAIELKPGEKSNLEVQIELAKGKDAPPGFYHVFVRLEGEGDFVRYAWAEARHAGAPKIDTKTSPEITYAGDALAFDFNRPLAVVYPVEASVMELEAAWVLYQTLESATGRVVEIYQSNDLPDARKQQGGIIWVGKGKADKPTVMREGDGLTVTGKDEQQVTRAAMDLTLRYWPSAKDSAASKVGLVAASAGKGGVKTDLD